MSTHPVSSSKPANAANSAPEPTERRSSGTTNPHPPNKASANVNPAQPNKPVQQKPPVSLAKSQQILRARYKQQWLPPRTWRQEEARKQQEEQLPVIDHRIAARAAEAHSKAIVAAQDKYLERLRSRPHAKPQAGRRTDVHNLPEASKPGIRSTPNGTQQQHITRTAASPHPHGSFAQDDGSQKSSNTQHSASSQNSASAQKPVSTQKQTSTQNQSYQQHSPSKRPFRPSLSHQHSSGRVPFPSIESASSHQANQTGKSGQVTSRNMSPNSRQANSRPPMRRNSSALSLVAAVQATRSPSIRSNSTSSSRRSSIVSSAESAALSASNNAPPSVSTNPPTNRSHSASIVGAIAADFNSTNAEARGGNRSRNTSLSGDSRSLSMASQQSQTSSKQYQSRSHNPSATARPQSMFGGVPAPKNQTASAAARASSSHAINIAPRAPLSSKFVKSLSQALLREQDQSDEQRIQKEALDRELQARKDSQAPALSSLALANVTKKLGHAPGNHPMVSSRRNESGSGSHSGANSAYQVATAAPGTNASITEQQQEQQRKDEQKRANAQQAATIAGSRFEEFMANIHTQVNQAMLAEQPRRSRRELMKKYRPAASWSAPVRVIRPQLKRLTTSDTTNSALCGAPESAKSSKSGNVIQTPTQYTVKNATNDQGAGDANATSAVTAGSHIGPTAGESLDSPSVSTPIASSGATSSSSNNNAIGSGYEHDNSSSVGLSPASSHGPLRHLAATVPARMATTLRKNPRRPRQPAKSEPESDRSSVHSVSSSPATSISELKPKQSALGYGAGNLYGGLAAPAGLYDSSSSKSSSQHSILPNHPFPITSQPTHMLSSLRTKFDNPNRRRFDEDRPWRGHRELMSVSERERKRYESLWAANRDRHLPHLYVPPQFQEAWLDALEQVLPSLKPAISAERDNMSDTASIRTGLRAPSVKSTRSFASMKSGMSYHSPPFQTPNQTPNRTPNMTPVQYPGYIPQLPAQSSQIYVPFGPSQPPPSLLIQSQQHQQQNNTDRMMMFNNNHSSASVGSSGTAPQGFTGSSGEAAVSSPCRSSLRHAFSQNSFESASGDFPTASNQMLSPSLISPNYTSSEPYPTSVASAAPKEETPTEEEEGEYVEVPPEEIDMMKEVEKRTNDVHGYIVSRIWRRSQLPEDTLSHIWDLVDNNHDGTLDSSGFVVGMWLCDQCLYGRKLPPKVPSEVWQSVAPLNLKIRVKERRSKIGHVKKLPNYFGNAVGFTMHSGRQAVKRAVQTATK